VAAAARALERAAPHLGAGVVLAVVDPGVGSERRGVAIEVGTEMGPHWMVGPDNGLLLPAARLFGGPRRSLSLGAASTFDGRDVFAPAAAHLVAGGAPDDLGPPIDVDRLTALTPDATDGSVSVSAGRLTTSVIWVDRFGNVQLAGDLPTWEQAGVVPGARAMVELGASPAEGPGGEQSTSGGGRAVRARRVSAYSSLDPDELGLLLDANGHLALVLDRASAASMLGVTLPGTVVRVQVGA
jgi:S-adenosylmethionine hydrolase